MSDEIKRLFDENLNIQPTPSLAKAIISHINAYETRDQHPLAFNSPFLGIYPSYFLAKDRDDFFALFNSSEKEIKALINKVISPGEKICGLKMANLLTEFKALWTKFFTKQAIQGINGIATRDVRHIISEMSVIKENFRVASDPFNLFITYAIHLFLASKLSKPIIFEVVKKMMTFLQYKFFTSLVNHRFKYPPDEDVMRAMYEQLSMKFDIKKYGTWRAVLEARSEDFIGEQGVHTPAMTLYDDDKKIVYFITDTQTRVRNQINTITEEFMKVKESSDRIGSYSTTGTDVEGEKIIVDGDEAFESMSSAVYNDSLVVTRFLDDQSIKLVANLFSNILIATFRSFLINVSELATKQYKSKKTMEVKQENGIVIDIGLQVLIFDVVQKSYRYAINQGIDINNPVKLITCIKDVYSSSRVSDTGIIQVRESVTHLVKSLNVSSRDATIASYRIGFILYIVLLTIKYRK